MLKKPLVSVIIPSYNSAEYITDTISSALNQTYSNLEILVVDDGSKDNTRSLLEDIKDNRVRVFSQLNQGACAARNKGFLLSKGDYIQFLDADDIISPGKIELQLNQLHNQKECISNGRWGRFYSSINEPIQWGPDISLRRDLEPVEWLIQNHMSQTACWLSPRNLIQQAGLWREDLKVNQDGEFFSRVILHSRKVLYCSEAKVYYRSKVSGSISSAIQKPAAIQSRFKAIELLEKELLERENSVRVRQSLANAYQKFIYSYFPKQPHLLKKAELRVLELGGSKLTVPGGRLYRFISKLLGWKNVSTLKHLLGRL